MTQRLLQQIVQDRSERPVTEQYRLWRAEMLSRPDQSCKPSGGPAARTGRFVGFDADGLAEFVMPEGF